MRSMQEREKARSASLKKIVEMETLRATAPAVNETVARIRQETIEKAQQEIARLDGMSSLSKKGRASKPRLKNITQKSKPSDVVTVVARPPRKEKAKAVGGSPTPKTSRKPNKKRLPDGAEITAAKDMAKIKAQTAHFHTILEREQKELFDRICAENEALKAEIKRRDEAIYHCVPQIAADSGKFVFIFGVPYVVNRVESVARESYRSGEINIESGSIRLSKYLQAESAEVTFLHEIIHAMLQRGAYNDLYNDEHFIDWFAMGFWQLLRDNPNLLEVCK